MTDYHKQIRQRMGTTAREPNPDARYIYRGAGLETMREEILDTGIVRATECDIIRGEIDGNPRGPPVPQRGDKLTDLNWVGNNFTVERNATAVVGGMTDLIGMTRRFRGTWDLIAVLEADMTRFEPVEYSREWMDAHPGALCHVLTTTDAEVRLESEGLYGMAQHKPDADGTRSWRVENWGSLPATSEESRFANESEWVSFNPLERIGDAVRGIASIMSERSVGFRHRSITDGDDIPDADEVADVVYDHIRSKLDNPRERVILVVTKDDGTKSNEMWPVSQIAFGYDTSGRLEPSEIPPEFRGEQP